MRSPVVPLLALLVAPAVAPPIAAQEAKQPTWPGPGWYVMTSDQGGWLKFIQSGQGPYDLDQCRRMVGDLTRLRALVSKDAPASEKLTYACINLPRQPMPHPQGPEKYIELPADAQVDVAR